MTWKPAFAATLLVTLGLAGASLAHEASTAPRTGTPQLDTPCYDTNGQATACEGGYQGNTDRGQFGTNQAPDEHGPAMMQGSTSTPGQSAGQTPRAGGGMN